MLPPLVGLHFFVNSTRSTDLTAKLDKLVIVRLEPRTFGVRGFQSANSDTLRMSTTVLHWPRLLFRVISRIQDYFSLSILFWIGRWTKTKNLKSGFFSFKLASSSSSSSSDKIFSFSGGVESKNRISVFDGKPGSARKDYLLFWSPRLCIRLLRIVRLGLKQ